MPRSRRSNPILLSSTCISLRQSGQRVKDMESDMTQAHLLLFGLPRQHLATAWVYWTSKQIIKGKYE